MSNPFDGWSKLNEDWDSGVHIDVNDLMGNVGTFAKNFLGPVAMLLVGIWTLKFLLAGFVGILYGGAELAQIDALWTVGNVFGYLSMPLMIAVILCQMSLYRPLQLQAFEGKSFVGGIGDAFRLSKDVAVKVAIVTVLYFLSVGVGALLCGVGSLLATFFFIQAPYLAATTELPPMECMRRSYELSKAYFMPVLAAIVASLAIVGGLSCIGGGIVGVVAALLKPISIGLFHIVLNIGSDMFGLFGAAFTLIFSGAMFTSIQSAELSRPIVRD